MVIGAFTGIAAWRLLLPIVPFAGHDPAPYAVIGMMALFGAIARAARQHPDGGGNDRQHRHRRPRPGGRRHRRFMVHRFDDSIYRSQLRTRADSETSQMRAGLTMIDMMPVSTAAVPPPVLLRAGQVATEPCPPPSHTR
jgi:hypothetical protein